MSRQETHSLSEDAGATSECTEASPFDMFSFALSDSWDCDSPRRPLTTNHSEDTDISAVDHPPPIASVAGPDMTSALENDRNDDWLDAFWDTLTPPRVTGGSQPLAQETQAQAPNLAAVPPSWIPDLPTASWGGVAPGRAMAPTSNPVVPSSDTSNPIPQDEPIGNVWALALALNTGRQTLTLTSDLVRKLVADASQRGS